jgi:hypothetical protein
MAFSICFTGEPDEYLGDDPNTPYAIGRIVAGELDENFASTLYDWKKCDYEAQWLHSLERLIAGEQKVALITSYVNPGDSSNLVWWALYRGQGDLVHVQNHLRLYDQLGDGFSVATASAFLDERITVDEDGNRISEWCVSLAEIKLFVDHCKKMNR